MTDGKYEKLICESKRMEGISKVLRPEDFTLFAQQVVMVCRDRYPLLPRWQEWISRQQKCPSPEDVASWCGISQDVGEVMGRDVWGILVQRIHG